VSEHELGRVVDPAALDQADGARGRLQIEVPPDWLAGPCEIDVVVPLRVTCARCDGGGCDGCGRSGAVHAPRDGAARTVRVALPEGGDGVALRLAHPFGPEGGIAQLILEIRRGARPSPGVTRLAKAPAPLRKPALAWTAFALAALAATAAALVELLAR
jgi:hypothetical protein